MNLVDKFVSVKIACVHVYITVYVCEINDINVMENILSNHLGDSFLWVYLSITTIGTLLLISKQDVKNPLKSLSDFYIAYMRPILLNWCYLKL